MCCVSVHVHHKLCLASRLSLSQCMCVQCGRSKRKSFWNDGKKAAKVLQEYPFGTGSNANEERLSLLSRTQDKQQVTHQMSTPDTPPLDMWAAHLGAPSLPVSPPSNPSLHKQTSLLVPPNVITTIPCTSFCWISSPRYSVLTTVVSFGIDTVRDCVVISFLLRCQHVFDSFTLWCVLGCHLYYFLFLWRTLLAWAFSFRFVLHYNYSTKR